MKPEHVSWIGGHFPLVSLCSFFVKGHGEGAGVFVLKGHAPPVAPSSVNGHREPRPHGPAFLRRMRIEGYGLGGWARGQGTGQLTPRGTAERASGLGQRVTRCSGAGLLRRARWTPVGRARGPPSPGGTGLGRPWLPPGTQGGRNSRRPPPPALTVVRPRDSGDSASPEATEMR